MFNPQPPTSNPQPPASSLYACLYHPASGQVAGVGTAFLSVAEAFSPRFHRHGDGLLTIDVGGLGRVIGPPRAVGEALRRDLAGRAVRAHVALAGTHTAARLLAAARPGLTVVEAGGEALALAGLPIRALATIDDAEGRGGGRVPRQPGRGRAAGVQNLKSAMAAMERWGLATLGEVAALPAADVSARLGQRALAWQAAARGVDLAPFVPDAPEERFESSLELDWPIDGLEPLSFVLTRLLEPLSLRLERRDRGAARLHVVLDLVSDTVHARRLDLPAPIRDVRSLRTLALLDLEAHPPSAAIDRVAIVIDPTPGRIVQHTLYARATPAPENLATLVARLGALMGQDRIGTPARVDSYAPGAHAVSVFAVEHQDRPAACPQPPREQPIAAALRRCRQPVPARVASSGGRPVRVTTDRQGFGGGAVTLAAGPWRTSGGWWEMSVPPSWDRDEWDVMLGDGAVYRVFRDRETDAWFIDGIFD